MIEKIQEYVEFLDSLDDRSERIQALIEISRKYKPVPSEIATKPFDEAHKIPGCESEVYLWNHVNEEQMNTFHFAVENPQGISAMTMAAIITEAFNGESRERIQTVSEDVVHLIFGEELSMGKTLGLTNMVRACKSLAR